MKNGDGFAIPGDLSARGRRAAGLIVDYLRRDDRLRSGGCRVFYSPRSWARREEKYGLKSVVIVVHDGGDHAQVFNGQDSRAGAQLAAILDADKFWVEGCTCWYSAVYDARSGK